MWYCRDRFGISFNSLHGNLAGFAVPDFCLSIGSLAWCILDGVPQARQNIVGFFLKQLFDQSEIVHLQGIVAVCNVGCQRRTTSGSTALWSSGSPYV
ncbi:hypothetical protein NKDENANG_01539 [Candidatus Entotheonellaceae bacterium PAL068K]